jgi:hypothetical protein
LNSVMKRSSPRGHNLPPFNHDKQSSEQMNKGVLTENAIGSGRVDEREHDKIDSELPYSPSLERALNLILGDPAFVGERETSSFKFIRAARFLNGNAPRVFQIREMGTDAKNGMDRWLWDLLV